MTKNKYDYTLPCDFEPKQWGFINKSLNYYLGYADLDTRKRLIEYYKNFQPRIINTSKLTIQNITVTHTLTRQQINLILIALHFYSIYTTSNHKILISKRCNEIIYNFHSKQKLFGIRS